MSKVLLLTASFGDGHNQAAYAVREALERRGLSVRVVDYVEWLHPAVRSFAKFSLLQGVQKVPKLYGLFYRSMSRIEPSSSLQRQLNHFGISHMKQYLRAYDPDVVVSTFPTPTGVLSELRGTGFTQVPNLAIVTDYTAHRQWIQEHTDLYFVATESVKREMVSYGVEPSRVEVTGIPIRSAFDESSAGHLLMQRVDLRHRHGLSTELPLVLMMGGGAGLLGDVSAWEHVVKRVDAQFCFICGHNERLRRRLQVLKSNRVIILGYTHEVDQWMAMSDMIVGKAGGMTVTEALAMELPMLLYRPIPGQEERNARFSVQIGAAQLAYDFRTAARLLAQAVENPGQLERMREAARKVNVRGGADRIADHVMRLCGAHGAQAHENFASTQDTPTVSERRFQSQR